MNKRTDSVDWWLSFCFKTLTVIVMLWSYHYLRQLTFLMTSLSILLGTQREFQNILFHKWWDNQSCWQGYVNTVLLFIYLLLGLHICLLALKNVVLTYFCLQFFEMPRHEAVKALDVYKRAGQQVGYWSTGCVIHFSLVLLLSWIYKLWHTSTYFLSWQYCLWCCCRLLAFLIFMIFVKGLSLLETSSSLCWER